MQRVQQQAHKQRMAALAQTIRAENAKSISLPLSRPQVQQPSAEQVNKMILMSKACCRCRVAVAVYIEGRHAAMCLRAAVYVGMPQRQEDGH